MKQIIKTMVILSTIFSVYLILSTAFIQPVTAQASSQLEITKKYENQLNIIKEFFIDISNDKEIQTLLTTLSNDKIPLASESLTSLSSNKAYINLKNILTTKYKEELNTITEFVTTLQENLYDGMSLINTILASDTIPIEAININPDNCQYLIEFEPEALPLIPSSENSNEQTGVTPVEGGIQSIYGDNGITFETGEATQQIQGNDNDASATPGGSAQNFVIMQDLDGNIYIHIPNYGWINLPTTWFPFFWLIILLFTIFDIIYMTIGWILYVGIPGIIFGTIYLIIYLIILITNN